jgi:ParB family chromosome partitioning protein
MNTNNTKETIKELSISELRHFKEHPYRVVDDEEMDRLIESIEEHGVMTPINVRPIEGGYEVISGHRRIHAAKRAGLATIPAIEMDMTRDQAAVALVDSNLHREKLLPSEKAFAYKLKLEALAHQGTSRQVGEKWSVSQISNEGKDSERQIHRYIRLTNLIPKLLDLVDNGSIALTTAVELSYLKPHEQEWVQDAIEYEECTPSLSQAGRLKKASQERTLTKEDVLFLMQEEKPNQRAIIKISRSELDRYFPKDYTDEQIKEAILKSLDNQRRERLRRERDSR